MSFSAQNVTFSLAKSVCYRPVCSTAQTYTT